MAPQATERLPLCSAEMALEIGRRLRSNYWQEAPSRPGFNFTGEGPAAHRLGFGLCGLDSEHPPGTPSWFRAVSHSPSSLALWVHVVMTCLRLEDDRPPRTDRSDDACYDTCYRFWGWLVAFYDNDDASRVRYRLSKPFRVRGLYSCNGRSGFIQAEPEPYALQKLQSMLASMPPEGGFPVRGHPEKRLVGLSFADGATFPIQVCLPDESPLAACLLKVCNPGRIERLKDCYHVTVQIRQLIEPQTTWVFPDRSELRLVYNLETGSGLLVRPTSATA